MRWPSRLAILVALAGLAVPALAGPPWTGWVDASASLGVDRYDFGIAGGGNENYYDGDFADFDGDGLPDRALISRYGLLHNQGGGEMVPVAHQTAGQAPCSRVSLVDFSFDDCQNVGNDGVQWADIDGDGDPDNIQGGNGEPFTVQANRGGRFAVKRKYGGSALNIANTDLEGDGDVDLAVAHAFCSNRSCGGPVEFHLWVNDGFGNFTDEAVPRGLSFPGEFITGVVSGDVDGDADFDLVLMNGARIELTIAFNDGQGNFPVLGAANFKRPKSQLFEIGSGFEQHLQLGDIDADGDLDLVVSLPENYDTGPLGPVGFHPVVSHAIFVNDGRGSFVEESDTRFDSGTYSGVLKGGNGKLTDVDYDGDLDLVAYDKPGPVFLQVYLNDGTGRFTWRPDLVTGLGFIDAGELGADLDFTDLDGDGTYDAWVGLANQKVHILLNPWRDPVGLPADQPRDLRVEAVAPDAVTLSWEWPRWAASNRSFRVYRSLAPRMGPIDRRMVRAIARSVHEDDSFAAPITAFTASLGDPDVAIDGRARRVYYTDRNVTPGLRYHYAVSHVGTERTESRRTPEVEVGLPPPPGPPDALPPEIRILSPTAEQWSVYPRIVLEFADGGAGVDPASLDVSFDVAVGGLPPGTNLAPRFQRSDGNAWILALRPGDELPLGVATLTASIRDQAGNPASDQVTFNVSVLSASPPVAAGSAILRPGTAVADLDATASFDLDGEVLRWEWYTGDGGFELGRTATHRFAAAGTYPVTLLVRDNDGGVGTSTTMVTVAGGPLDSDGDGAVDGADCAPLDPRAWATPAEVRDLKLTGGPGGTILRWTDQGAAAGPGTLYDLAGGPLAGLRALGMDAAAGCLVPDLTTSATIDTTALAPGAGLFFVVRARNACGHGSWGAGRSFPACP